LTCRALSGPGRAARSGGPHRHLIQSGCLDALSESPTRLALPASWFQQCCHEGGGSYGAKRCPRPCEGYGVARRIGSSRIGPHRGIIGMGEAAEGEKPWDGRFPS
jgi:hypothetical protein